LFSTKDKLILCLCVTSLLYAQLPLISWLADSSSGGKLSRFLFPLVLSLAVLPWSDRWYLVLSGACLVVSMRWAVVWLVARDARAALPTLGLLLVAWFLLKGRSLPEVAPVDVSENRGSRAWDALFYATLFPTAVLLLEAVAGAFGALKQIWPQWLWAAGLIAALLNLSITGFVGGLFGRKGLALLGAIVLWAATTALVVRLGLVE